MELTVLWGVLAVTQNTSALRSNSQNEACAACMQDDRIPVSRGKVREGFRSASIVLQSASYQDCVVGPQAQKQSPEIQNHSTEQSNLKQSDRI